MKKIYKKFFISILFLAVLFCMTSCSETTSSFIATLTTEPSTTTQPILDIGQYVSYTYSDDISETEKTEFEIANADNINYLVEFNIITNQNVTYYISDETYNFYNLHSDVVWLFKDDANTFDALFNTILAISDPIANYGLMYGLSNYIAKELGYEYNITVRETSQVFGFLDMPENNDYYDITYPCFFDVYATEDQISYSYDFSILISDYIIEEHGLNAIIELINETEDLDQFEADFVEYKNEWLLVNLSSMYLTPSEYPVAFAQEHVYNQLEWKTDHAYWIMANDFEEFNSDLYSDYSFNTSYSKLLIIIRTLETEMDYVDGILKDDEIDYIDLTIHFDNDAGGGYGGGRIFTCTLYILLHEYIHYLTSPYLDILSTSAVDEWFSCYYGYFSIYEQIPVMSSLENDFNDLGESFADVFTDHYGHEFDYNTDLHEKFYISQYIYNIYDDANVYHRPYYPSFASFPAYFIDTYGEEVLIAVVKDYSLLDDYTGKTWNEIFSDWEDFIKTNYSWVDEYIEE